MCQLYFMGYGLFIDAGARLSSSSGMLPLYIYITLARLETRYALQSQIPD